MSDICRKTHIPHMHVNTYFATPDEHNRALMETAIRALMQLQERWRNAPQAIEQELAFAELTLRRIHREMPL